MTNSKENNQRLMEGLQPMWPTPKATQQAPDSVREEIFRGRDLLEAAKEQIISIKRDVLGGVFDMSQCKDQAELLANLQLAYRHLEDARMRLGKSIQAYEGKDCLSR